MPTLLSSPTPNLAKGAVDEVSLDHSTSTDAPLSDASVQSDGKQSRPFVRRAMPGRRVAGLVCLALAALLAVVVGGTSLTLAYQLGNAARATALIAISDLGRHVLPRSVDTA